MSTYGSYMAMILKITQAINRAVAAFDIGYFYFSLIYYLLFGVATIIVEPAYKNLIVPVAVGIILLRLFSLWAYGGETFKKIGFINKYKEFFALLVLDIVINHDHVAFLTYNFGVNNTIFFIAIFVIGFFIGLKTESA